MAVRSNLLVATFSKCLRNGWLLWLELWMIILSQMHLIWDVTVIDWQSDYLCPAMQRRKPFSIKADSVTRGIPLTDSQKLQFLASYLNGNTERGLFLGLLRGFSRLPAITWYERCAEWSLSDIIVYIWISKNQVNLIMIRWILQLITMRICLSVTNFLQHEISLCLKPNF